MKKQHSLRLLSVYYNLPVLFLFLFFSTLAHQILERLHVVAENVASNLSNLQNLN